MVLGTFTVTTAGTKQLGPVVRAKTFLLQASENNAGNIIINRLGDDSNVMNIAPGDRLPLPGPFFYEYEFDADNDGENFSWLAIDV